MKKAHTESELMRPKFSTLEVQRLFNAIESLKHEKSMLIKTLKSIASNTCCGKCQEAAKQSDFDRLAMFLAKTIDELRIAKNTLENIASNPCNRQNCILRTLAAKEAFEAIREEEK